MTAPEQFAELPLAAISDGVVVLPGKRAQDIAAAAEYRIGNETRILRALRKSGDPLYKLLGIDLGSWQD